MSEPTREPASALTALSEAERQVAPCAVEQAMPEEFPDGCSNAEGGLAVMIASPVIALGR
ncbi:MAG: hypothetical protein H7145_17505 [Akkermansiaceae bacterium]|nr:hypothetical protein [Armatimonadota bacterium]